MVAALFQVHHDVEKGDLVSTLRVQGFKVPRQDVLVVFPEKQDVELW